MKVKGYYSQSKSDNKFPVKKLETKKCWKKTVIFKTAGCYNKRKADYNKDMQAYNKRQCEGTKKEDYEKSDSEVHDDDDDDDEEANEEDDSGEDADYDLDKDVPSLADEPSFEKAPYVAEAGKRKADYEKDMNSYNIKQCDGTKKELESSKSWNKAVKDPDMPKRPASAFFVFMEEFRPTYKENNPDNKSVSRVGIAGGAKWKSMSGAEKAPYLAEAEKRKADYEKDMKAYCKRQSKGTIKEDYEKSESEVHDDEDDNAEDDSGEDGEYDLDKDVPSLADESLFEKAPCVAEAGKRKADHEKDMKAYNKRQCEGSKKEDYEKSESEDDNEEDNNEEDDSGEDGEDDNEEDNKEDDSGEDSDFETDKDVPNLADEPFLERGKTITSIMPQASFSSSSCYDTHASFSASSQRSADLTTDMRNAAVLAMTSTWLQSLKTDNLDQVEASADSAYSLYEFIRNIGGDPSELQTLIDAYVRSLKVLLVVKDESSVDVSEVEKSFQSAQATYEHELRVSKDLEKQLSEVTHQKVALETTLQTLCEEEKTLKEQCRQQVDRTSMSKSSVSSLQQKMKFVEKLKKTQDNVNKCKERLEAAML